MFQYLNYSKRNSNANHLMKAGEYNRRNHGNMALKMRTRVLHDLINIDK